MYIVRIPGAEGCQKRVPYPPIPGVTDSYKLPVGAGNITVIHCKSSKSS